MPPIMTMIKGVIDILSDGVCFYHGNRQDYEKFHRGASNPVHHGWVDWGKGSTLLVHPHYEQATEHAPNRGVELGVDGGLAT